MYYKEKTISVQSKNNLVLIFKQKNKFLKNCNYFPLNINPHSFGLVFYIPVQKSKELFSFFFKLTSYNFSITRSSMDFNLVIAWTLDFFLFQKFLKSHLSFVSTNRILFLGYYFNLNLCHQVFKNSLLKGLSDQLNVLKVLKLCINRFCKLVNANLPANITCRTS